MKSWHCNFQEYQEQENGIVCLHLNGFPFDVAINNQAEIQAHYSVECSILNNFEDSITIETSQMDTTFQSV